MSMFDTETPCVPWNVWDVVRAIGLIVLVTAAALVVLAMLEPGPVVTAVVLVLPHSSMLAAVWLFGVRNRDGWRPVGFVAPPHSPGPPAGGVSCSWRASERAPHTSG